MDKDIKTLHEELESGSITSEELVKEAIKDSYTAKEEYNAVVTFVDNASSKEVTKELNAKHAKELTEKLAEKDRIISAYQLLAKHTPIAQIAAETGLSEEAIRAL